MRKSCGGPTGHEAITSLPHVSSGEGNAQLSGNAVATGGAQTPVLAIPD
jgi:hypothetical protein